MALTRTTEAAVADHLVTRLRDLTPGGVRRAGWTRFIAAATTDRPV
ncbi:hypothetical protein SAMN04489732_107127 [Amycolatopsis saalfeldensis]|uniref:Uncharacterized protein n=2 Tax=Amycolatopsis saalfeldensis TaxID=394193 RepID=A0A1H8XEG4_9PSEU|nr:hypothetical protein SAMN04489732_107127 [Amycolatopsis saalfeldensis]